MNPWRDAYDLLRRRADGAAELVRAAIRSTIPALPIDPRAVRCFVCTGIGSSAAHAALFAHLLNELGLPARVAAPGVFVAPPRQPGSDVLVLFSQGLSPNARLALRHAAAWGGVVLVTAIGAGDDDPDKRAAVAAVERAGGVCVPLPGGAEFGTLLRVAGPLAGYALAYRLAAAVADAAGRPGGELAIDADAVCAGMAAARAAADALPADALDGRLAVLASGGYGDLAGNLSLKIQEGLFAPRPPIWDLIEFAHGPFQEIEAHGATLLLLRRRAAPLEGELVSRLQRMLVPARHRLVSLGAELPGAQALFEHDALLTELLLRAIAARQIDQAHRPDRERDRPLYEVAEPAPDPPPPAPPPAHELGGLAWPELAALLAGGHRTAVLPLGATEQHGPHLPYAADTIIADALAERFCARIGGAVRVPALPFGCSAEHSGFPGTVSLHAESLRALLCDAVASLARHGFETLFIFSAHGGNYAALRAAAPALRAAAPTARIIVFTDLDATAAAWHRAAAAAGISAAAAGHHAGEFETSLLLALRPGAVRRDQLAAGLLDVGGDAQAIFYPDLRRHAASGVVGDPRAATAARADGYLDAWVDVLVEHYRREKNAANTSGTQNA